MARALAAPPHTAKPASSAIVPDACNANQDTICTRVEVAKFVESPDASFVHKMVQSA